MFSINKSFLWWQPTLFKKSIYSIAIVQIIIFIFYEQITCRSVFGLSCVLRRCQGRGLWCRYLRLRDWQLPYLERLESQVPREWASVRLKQILLRWRLHLLSRYPRHQHQTAGHSQRNNRHNSHLGLRPLPLRQLQNPQRFDLQSEMLLRRTVLLPRQLQDLLLRLLKPWSTKP